MTENKTPHSFHDRGYKHLLSFYKIFQQLIEGYVDGDWKELLDFENSQRIETSFILKEYEQIESDVIYKVPLLGQSKEIYLYVLIEHQSSVDYSISFRVLSYLVQIWVEFYKNANENERKQKSFRLPPVFPIVIYNGEKEWTAASSVREIVEHGELFSDFIPNVRYHLVNIPKLEVERLKKEDNVLASVFMLEHEIKSEEFKKTLHEILDIVYKETDEELFRAFIEWMRMLFKREHPEELANLFDDIDLTKQNRQEIRTMLETMPEKLVAYGEEKGMAKGEKRGMAKGRLDEKREIAIEMLKDNVGIEQIIKFTKLPEEEILKLKAELEKK